MTVREFVNISSPSRLVALVRGPRSSVRGSRSGLELRKSPLTFDRLSPLGLELRKSPLTFDLAFGFEELRVRGGFGV